MVDPNNNTPSEKWDKLPNLFLFNGTFDLDLGRFPTDRVRPAVDEMACLFGLVGTDTDRQILSVELPKNYPTHLKNLGLSFATPYHNESRGSFSAFPWGWTEQAVATLRSFGAVVQSPPLHVVRTVNCRKLIHERLAKYGCGVPGSRFCNSPEECASVIRGSRPYVVKPAFGSAGFGFIRTSSTNFTASQRKTIAAYINQTGEGVSVEPWLNRTGDLSTSGIITLSGELRDITVHRTLNNSAGAFFAVLLSRDDPRLRPWREQLVETAKNAAAEAARAGYFGPIGLDSFLYKDGSRTLPAPVIEINARHTMGTIARAVRDRLSPESFCIFRFISRKRHRLPESYHELEERLGALAYNANSRKGIFLLTPLRVAHADGKWKQPSRSAFFISAENEKTALAWDTALRGLLV